MQNAENDLDSFITYLLFEKKGADCKKFIK